MEELRATAQHTGIPCVIKPVMSSSGKGQSEVRSADQLGAAWDYAVSNSRGDEKKVIVEEFIRFHLEITLLTVRQWDGPTLFVKRITGHTSPEEDRVIDEQYVGKVDAELVKMVDGVRHALISEWSGAPLARPLAAAQVCTACPSSTCRRC